MKPCNRQFSSFGSWCVVMGFGMFDLPYLISDCCLDIECDRTSPATLILRFCHPGQTTALSS